MIILCNSIFAQDTIHLEESKIYYNNEHINTKNRYADELIQITIDSFKIEECYYLFSKKPFRKKEKTRKSNLVSSYKIIGDSIIKIYNYNYTEKWNFIKLSDSLYTVNSNNETGFVNQLIPFTRHGEFRIYKKNELQITRFYDNGIFTNYSFPNPNIFPDSVYHPGDIDFYPKYHGGQETLQEFIRNEFIYSYATPVNQIRGRIIVKYIVGKNGNIIHASILRGIDPLIDSEALRVVYSIDGYTAGIKENNKVNVEMIIPIDLIIE